jgi:hypothetical protein
LAPAKNLSLSVRKRMSPTNSLTLLSNLCEWAAPEGKPANHEA